MLERVPKKVSSPLSRSAQRDANALLKVSRQEFGTDAAERYYQLLTQAIRDILNDPYRLGSKQPTDLLGGIRTYHIELSKDRVIGEKVRNPRHVLVYRPLEDGVEILRILHDSRILSRAIPAKYHTP